MVTMLHIDGSYGEGGGQLIRTALALAAMTQTGITLTNIRAGRAKPGLQAQHLTAVQLAADLCAAQVNGAVLGSVSLRFLPQGAVAPGVYLRDIGTAGAMALVFQTALLPLACADASSRVRLTGGSHVTHAPSIDYLTRVYGPALQRAGVQTHIELLRTGFFPRGGGEAQLAITPVTDWRPLDLTVRGALRRLTAVITTSGLTAHVAERGAKVITQVISQLGLKRQLIVETCDLPSNGAGAAILLAAECEAGHAGFIALGARGLPMEQVAERACHDFMDWWRTDAACDVHLADQLVLPMALAGLDSQWTTPEVTEHLRTVIWLVEQFVPVKFTLMAQASGTYLVQVRPQKWGRRKAA